MAQNSLSERDLVRLQCEQDLYRFIKLIHPKRMLGLIHIELIRWITREEAKNHQLVLLPREHQKSAIAGYYAAWLVTRNPSVRILYVSSTAQLAIKQLKFIKDILTCSTYRFYWPEMVNLDEGKREKWSETEISVDHPKRKADFIRDPTIFTAGLTTNIVGMHSDYNILDDCVVNDTAYLEEGRDKLETQYSLLANIATTNAKEIVVGTRYFPTDLYGVLSTRMVECFDSDGNRLEDEPLFEIFERVVEDRGDGTGEFLWPRSAGIDGKEFGFNTKILMEKKGQMLSLAHFYSQYYNNPNFAENAFIPRDKFQYYNRQFLQRYSGRWYYRENRLNVFAAVDFAFSKSLKADYTAIVVVAVDAYNNYYVLDIDRFKANQPSEYF